MANPQVEDGFVKISRELLEALCRTPLGGARRRVFDFILLKTYGWCKKSDKISLSQIQKATGLSKRTVIYSLQNLEAGRFIKIERGKIGEINKLGILKDYEIWVVQEKAEKYKQTIEKQKERYHEKVVQEKQGGARNSEKVVQETVNDIQFLAHTKETLTKETTKERERVSLRKKREGDPRIKRVLDHFHETHLKAKGVKPLIDGGTAKLAQKLVATYDQDFTLGLITAFFESNDEFIAKAGFSFGVFYSQAQKLATLRQTGPPNSWAHYPDLGKEMEKERKERERQEKEWQQKQANSQSTTSKAI